MSLYVLLYDEIFRTIKMLRKEQNCKKQPTVKNYINHTKTFEACTIKE